MNRLLSRNLSILTTALIILFSASGVRAADDKKAYPAPAGVSPQPSSSSGALVTSPSVTVLNLSQCIETALKRNPTILASQYGVNASQSRVGESRAAYYPQVSASASYYRIQPISVQTPTMRTSPDAYDQYAGSVTLSQNLIDFGKTSSQVDISKFNLESSRSDLRTTQDTITLSVKQAYYGVLQAKRNRDVAADVIKQFQLHLDQAKGFYHVGTKAKIDVIKAEVDLSNAKLSLINAENALRISWVTLNNVMGIPDAPEYQIEDDLSIHKFPITLEDAVARAYANRPDLQSVIAKRQAAETSIGLARTGYYPTLSGNASYNWAADRASDLDQGHYWSAGVLLTVPLFNGFLTTHQVAEAKANYYAAQANEETVRQQILLDVRQAYLNLRTADASIETAELAARQAKENLDLANGRYAAGVGSPVEVSDAFATYVTAQANYTQSLSNYKIAQANIEKAMGAR